MKHKTTKLTFAVTVTLGLLFVANANFVNSSETAVPSTKDTVKIGTLVPAQSGEEKIDRYRPRFGRKRPLVAVVAANSGTVLTDFMTPFNVLARSGEADVVSVSTEPGEVRMNPLRFKLQTTVAEFDEKYPQGADYVVVPAISERNHPVLVEWVKSQGKKGSSLMSICNGALTLAHTGLMDGHRATAHFGSETQRAETFPNVKWEKNHRYVADGKILSSAGISASLPISLALVEAIAGREKAANLAKELGVSDWSSRHNSDAFERRSGPMTRPDPATLETVGLKVVESDDEMSLALTAQAWGHNGRSKVLVLADSMSPVRTRHGLLLLPDQVEGGEITPALTLPALTSKQTAHVLDEALAAITKRYGRDAAYRVARMMEYPGFPKE